MTLSGSRLRKSSAYSCAGDSPLRNKENIRAEDLVDKPLILSRRSLVQKEMIHWFGKQYKTLNVIATYNLIYNAAIMVEEGLGYAFTLEHLSETEESLCFRPLDPPFEVGVVIAWKKYQVFSTAAKAFLERIKDKLELQEQRT